MLTEVVCIDNYFIIQSMYEKRNFVTVGYKAWSLCFSDIFGQNEVLQKIPENFLYLEHFRKIYKKKVKLSE